MLSFYTVFTFATAISALPSVRRDVTAVLNNLQTIDTNTNALTAQINSWDGSLLGALGINGAVSTLETSITDATTEANTEAQASSADSTTILNYVSGTLNPDITTSLNALTAREAEFASVGVTSIVLTDLTNLKSDTDALGAALINVASTDTQASATTLVSDIDAAFASAIAVFS